MRTSYWIVSVAALSVALPTAIDQTSHSSQITIPQQITKPGQISDKQPPVIIPNVSPGTLLVTDQPTGLMAYFGSAVTSVVDAYAWLKETLAVISGERDEQRGGSPAAGNGS